MVEWGAFNSLTKDRYLLGPPNNPERNSRKHILELRRSIACAIAICSVRTLPLGAQYNGQLQQLKTQL